VPASTLDDWLSYIASIHPDEIELGLSRVKAVWDRLAIPSIAKYTVLVAGTNGKGSTAFTLARLLMKSGYRVGVYSSPHISRYNERIQVNGLPLCDAEIVSGFTATDKAREGVSLTYFEFGTLAALSALAAHTLDVAILEVGLGGRLDAVNIIDADLAIVTSVALDHVDWLGDDLEQIGYEKAGIIKANSVALLGECLPFSVANHARDIGCPAFTYGSEFNVVDGVFHGNLLACSALSESKVEIAEKRVLAKSSSVCWDMPKSLVPNNNIALAAQAYLMLDAQLSLRDSELWPRTTLQEKLASFSISGRMEQLENYPNLYLDVCHNPHAANYISSILSRYNKKVVAVFSALEDKDIEGLVANMSASVDLWLIAPLNVPRAASIGRLESAVGQHTKDMLSFADLNAAMNESRRYISEDNLVLVFGSFFVVEAAKAFYSEKTDL
jgi:dihydrofolate synthase / folylpolyglutamate synthase